jgi:hypothetical protein
MKLTERRGDAAMVLAAFAASRALGYGGYLAARHLYVVLGPTWPRSVQVHRAGLAAWDAGYYVSIATHGYGHASGDARFFPLLPLVLALLHVAFPISPLYSGILVSNAFWLASGFALLWFLRAIQAESGLAEACLLILYLWPGSGTTITAYPEALFCFLEFCALAALARDRPLRAGFFGALMAATRPTGILVVAALLTKAVMDFLEGRRAAAARAWGACLLPGFALASFLAYLSAEGISPLAPYELQTRGYHHGGITAPFYQLAVGALRGHFTDLVHAVFVALVVVGGLCLIRHAPAPVLVYTLGGLLLLVSSNNFDGFERYVLDFAPALLGVAVMLRSEPLRTIFLAGLAAASLALVTFTYLGAWVP